MVVDTGAGAVHLIYMPKTQVIDGRSFTAGAMRAQLVALPVGSAVIVGAPDQPLDEVGRWVREGIAARPAAA